MCPEPEQPFLTLAEHAAAFRLAQNTVRNRIAAGTWPVRSVKVGKMILIPATEHQKLIDQLLSKETAQEISPPPPPPPRRGRPRAGTK